MPFASSLKPATAHNACVAAEAERDALRADLTRKTTNGIELEAELKQAGEAARKFIDKVERGKARSHETYADMTAIVGRPHMRRLMAEPPA